MLHMTVFWLVLLVGPWVVGYVLRRRAQERRRLTGRPPMSLAAELRWLLVLVVPWGMLLALGAYAIDRNCYEDEAYFIELAPGITADEYCDLVLRERFPGTLIAVSVFFAGVALVWTVSVLLFRRSERRRALVA